MKKLFVLAAILMGAATASQAGIRFNISFDLPLPLPPLPVIISRPAPVCVPAAPVVYEQYQEYPRYYPGYYYPRRPVYYGYHDERGYRGYHEYPGNYRRGEYPGYRR